MRALWKHVQAQLAATILNEASIHTRGRGFQVGFPIAKEVEACTGRSPLVTRFGNHVLTLKFRRGCASADARNGLLLSQCYEGGRDIALKLGSPFSIRTRRRLAFLMAHHPSEENVSLRILKLIGTEEDNISLQVAWANLIAFGFDHEAIKLFLDSAEALLLDKGVCMSLKECCSVLGAR